MHLTPTKLKDIADALGISVSTVSRALNNSGRVSPETRRRVLDLAERSSYTVNEVARSLRLRSTNNIGIVVPDIANTFFPSVIKGAQNVLGANGFTLMVYNTNENMQTEREALQSLLEKHVNGLILASVGGSEACIRQFDHMNVPVVFIDNLPNYALSRDWVSIDNITAAEQLTRSMIRRGYTDIGMLTGPLHQSTSSLRLKGYLNALASAQLQSNEQWILECGFDMDSGYRTMKALLNASPLPQAMIFANNQIAYGAIGAIREQGLRIPGDFAVASFDALDRTGLIHPVITSINQPADEIGARAAEIVLHRIRSEGEDGCIHAQLVPGFIDGNSW